MIEHRARRVAATGALLAIALAPASSPAAEPTRHAGREADRIVGYAFDLAVLRPIGFVRFVVGSAIAGVVWPFALSSGQGDAMVDKLVAAPAEYTFLRELGDF